MIAIFMMNNNNYNNNNVLSGLGSIAYWILWEVLIAFDLVGLDITQFIASDVTRQQSIFHTVKMSSIDQQHESFLSETDRSESNFRQKNRNGVVEE